MLESPRGRYVVLGLMLLAQTGASLISPGIGSLGPILAGSLELSKAQLGTISAAMMLGTALLLTPGGIIVDRYGERTIIFLGGLFMGLALIASAILPYYAWVLVWMFVVGMCYAPTTPGGGQAILSYFVTDRGMAMGVRQTGVTLGGAIAGAFLPLIAAHSGYRGAFVLDGVLCIACCSVATAFYRERRGPARGPAKKSDLRTALAEVVRDKRVVYLTVTCMAFVSAQSCTNAFIAVTATENGLPIAIAGLMFACTQLSAAVARILWGVASDRIFHGDRAMPLLFIAVLASVAALALALLGPGHTLEMFLAVVLMGASGASWNGLYAAGLAEIGGMERAGTVLGVGLTGIFAAGAISPPIFGLLADNFGLHAGWFALAAVTLLAVIPALLAMKELRRA
jgi:MFS family permease